jgi:hypothetical protein
MISRLTKICFWISGIGVVLFLVWITCNRGPSESEIKSHYADEANGRKITIDSTQGDIGYFGIQIDGEEQFFIETFSQWVLPGAAYDWPTESEAEQAATSNGG